MTPTAPGDARSQSGSPTDLLARFALQGRLSAHHAVLLRACLYAADEQRIVGLSLSGSLPWGAADRNSDIDLTVVVDGDDPQSAFAEHLLLLAAVGGGRYRAYDDLGPASVRTICEVVPFQVDAAAAAAQFSSVAAPPAPTLVSLDVVYTTVSRGMSDLGPFRWLYLRPDCRHLLRMEEMPEVASSPLSAADLRTLDGRFWWWLHVLALRARRGEVWHVLEQSALRLRSEVVLRLMADKAAQQFAGSRRIEQWLTPGLLDDLDATWSPARMGSLRSSLLGTAGLYRRLRDALAIELEVVFDRAAEDQILAIVHELPT